MNENNTNVMSFLEDRVIKLQSQITEMQDLIRHYRAVLSDYKRTVRVDYSENNENNYQNAQREENVTL